MSAAARHICPHWLGSGYAVSVPEAEIEAIVIGRNELKRDESGAIRARDTGDREVIECGLVFRSIGYKGIGLEGLPFDDAPAYVPVDEAVAEPNSTYSLGKLVEETMAAQFCRWNPDLSMIGLRFSNVMLVDDYADFPGYSADQRRFNLWSYIDARDAAQAVELALAYEPHGVEVFVIASPDVVPHVPVAQLLADRFGEVRHTRELGEYESPLSIDKARALLGYDPQHSWRDHV